MNRNIIIIAFLVLASHCSLGQGIRFYHTDKKRPERVTIEDTFFIKKISQYIESEQQQDSTAIKYGYFILKITSAKSTDSAGSNCYSILRSRYYFYDDFNDERFPSFYTFLKGRLILIYPDDKHYPFQYKLNKNEKLKFSSLVNKHLPKLVIEKARGNNNKTIELRPVGDFIHEPGITICL